MVTTMRQRSNYASREEGTMILKIHSVAERSFSENGGYRSLADVLAKRGLQVRPWTSTEALNAEVGNTDCQRIAMAVQIPDRQLLLIR